MSLAKELGLSETEYQEAINLQRIYQLTKQQLGDICPSCSHRSGISHIDHIRLELFCTQCAEKRSKGSSDRTVRKIGDTKVKPELLAALEAKYAKPYVKSSSFSTADRSLASTAPNEDDDDFNIWADLPITKPRPSKVRNDLKDEPDLPGMVGIVNQLNMRSIPPQIPEPPTAILPSTKGAEQLDITSVLRDLVENQKSLSLAVSRLAARLDHDCCSSSAQSRSQRTSPNARRSFCRSPNSYQKDLRLLNPRFNSPQSTSMRTKRNPFRDNPFI